MRCELHLVRRRGELEGHGEHQGDGAEGLQPLGPLAGGAPASTPTWSLDGRRLVSSGIRSWTRTRPQCSSELPAARSSMPAVLPAQERWGSSLTVRRYRFPEVGRWKVNVLSPIRPYHSWNHTRAVKLYTVPPCPRAPRGRAMRVDVSD